MTRVRYVLHHLFESLKIHIQLIDTKSLEQKITATYNIFGLEYYVTFHHH